MCPFSYRGRCRAGPGTSFSCFNRLALGQEKWFLSLAGLCWIQKEQTTYIRGWGFGYCDQTKTTTQSTALLLLNNNETLDVHVKKQQWSINLWPLAEERLWFNYPIISEKQKNKNVSLIQPHTLTRCLSCTLRITGSYQNTINHEVSLVITAVFQVTFLATRLHIASSLSVKGKLKGIFFY